MMKVCFGVQVMVKQILIISFVYYQNMQLSKGSKGGMCLSLKSITWYKDSHSLFDYESTKININSFAFPALTKTISLYRKRQSFNVIALEQHEVPSIDKEQYQFLTKFQIKPSQNNKFRLNFFNDTEQKLKKINSERLNTDESNSVSLREEQTFLIVRKQKDANGDPKGYRLQPGQTIKLGRVQYFVSEICINQSISTSKGNKGKSNMNKLTMKYSPTDKKTEEGETKSCKICLEEAESEENFLFNPCKCSGSCGAVHLQCLLQWISIKVKKEVVGGTQHYNFQKFQCQVCKAELPVIVEANSKIIELLPIQKPKGNYMILQGACEKTKSVMMIQNVPEGGIKLGRGHDCEIRITDISVSRNHAYIKFINNGFYLFDNKSKFGTLVKEDKMNIEIGHKNQKGIQIGRTIVILELCRQSQLLKEKKQLQKQKQITESKNLLVSKKLLQRDRR